MLLTPTSNIFLYGKGVFTTIRTVSGEPLFWDKHWVRLRNDSGKVGVDLSEFSETRVFDALKKELTTSGISDGRARITFLDQRSADIWPAEVEQNTTISILVGERRPLPPNFSVGASPYRVNAFSPLSGVKSCNYLENILALEEARSRGFHEALRTNHADEITGGCMSNVFWLKGGVLYTPSLVTGCLAGTTREFILESLDCREVKVGLEELNSADAIYLTSAGLGIVAVAEFEKRKLPNPPHQITELLTFN